MNLEISERERVLLLDGLTSLSKRRSEALLALQLALPQSKAITTLQLGEIGIHEIEDLARRLGGTSLGL